MITEARSGRRQLQKAETRAALLAAARDLILERGLAAVTCRSVTDRAGVSSGTFFVHFADTASLVEVLLDEHLAETLEGIGSTIPSGAGLVDELVHVSMRLYDSYAARPDLSRAYLTTALFRSDLDGPTSTRLRAFGRWVGERLDAAVDRGEIGADDRAHAGAAYFSLYFGLLVAGLRGEVTPADQEAALRWGLGRLVGTPGRPR